MHVIGYVRVSTDEQGKSGAGLEAQRAAILAEAQRRGWEWVTIIKDVGVSGKDLNRPGIRAALAALEQGDASALVVAKLDRLSRSMFDFAGIMKTARSRTGRWSHLIAPSTGRPRPGRRWRTSWRRSRSSSGALSVSGPARPWRSAVGRASDSDGPRR